MGRRPSSAKGGRPSTCDPEAILGELQRRYEGRPKPSSVKALCEDNPDISGNLKTLNNGARTFFGRTFGKELEARGLIEKTPRARASQSAGHSRQTGNVGRPRKPVPEVAEIDAAVDDMERRLKGVPPEDRPSTMAGLSRLFPEYEGHIDEGRKLGVVSKESLRQRGILRLPKSQAAAERKRARLSHIRNQELPELLARYSELGGPALAAPERNGALLRDGVLGFDVASMSELRETRLVVENARGLSVGDELAIELTRYERAPLAFETGRLRVSVPSDAGDDEVAARELSGLDEFTSAERFEGASPFAEHAGALVDEVFVLAGVPLAVVRYRFVVPLSKETLLYALRSLGVSVV